MKILVDSREQQKLSFPFNNVSEVKTQKLDVGDYGCQFEDGTIAPVFFERKNKGDLFGTLGKGHKRFRREIQRALDNNHYLFLIIECPLVSILAGYEYKARGGKKVRSKIKGTAIAKTLFTLWIKYGLFPVFCSGREEMSSYIYGTFNSLEKIHMKGK